jgi:cyclic pyranopterin phosphate synthase
LDDRVWLETATPPVLGKERRCATSKCQRLLFHRRALVLLCSEPRVESETSMVHLDEYSRAIHYLRVSVTDRCNLRCTYCMPPEGVPWQPHSSILSFEQIETVVRAAAELGISKVRITGGEPLARLGMVDLVRMLARVPGLDDLAMTTNGTLLAGCAADLCQAGLRRVNISLDTLRPERFHSITRLGRLEDALAGITAAHEAGLRPVKINMVVMRGGNDDEVLDLALKSVDEGWNVRFIEYMPVGGQAPPDAAWCSQVVTGEEMQRNIEARFGPLAPTQDSVGNGPARYYRIEGARGTLGFITPVSEHFCVHCNRLRLTADGQLRPCLLSDEEIDLGSALRRGADVPEIKRLLLEAIRSKPREHRLAGCVQPEKRAMSQIGG